MVAAIILLAVVSTCRNVCAVAMPGCGTDNAVEVMEDKTDNTVTCSGIPATTVIWRAAFPVVTSEYIVASCSGGNSCDSRTHSGYTATRPSADTSVMTIDPSRNPAWVLNATLACEAGTQSSSCRLDIISPPQGASCSVQTVTTTSPWTVTARCENVKTYSSLNRYRCQWYRKQGSAAETAVGQPVTMTTTPTNESTPTGGKYVTGRCDITTSWPTADTTDSYSVLVTPGSVRQVAGSVEIRKPTPSVQDCPQYAVEGRDLTCTCGGHAGTPPGVMKWAHVNSALLTLTNVQTSQDGDQYRCQGVWNGGTVVPEAVYIIKLAYPPSPPVITHTSSDYPPIAGVTPNTVLTCVSTTPGRPASTYTWPNNGGGLLISSQGQGILTFGTLRREDDGKTVTCRASNLHTANRNPVADGTYTLQVYYTPDITLSPVEGTNKCHLTNQGRSCEVVEGQRVHVRCTAVSNPRPTVFSWHEDGGAVAADADILDIASTNRTVHSGNYSCTVTTGGLGNGRPPLSSSKQITVLVKTSAPMTQTTVSSPGAAIGGSIAAATVVVIVLVVIVLFLRRRSRGSSDQETRGTFKRESELQTSTPAALTGPYETLTLKDVGVSAPYDVITYPGDSQDQSFGKTDLDKWAARNDLTEATVAVLKDQGFQTLGMLQLLTPEEVKESFQKPGRLPLAQCLALKNALHTLPGNINTPLASENTASGTPYASLVMEDVGLKSVYETVG